MITSVYILLLTAKPITQNWSKAVSGGKLLSQIENMTDITALVIQVNITVLSSSCAISPSHAVTGTERLRATV